MYLFVCLFVLAVGEIDAEGDIKKLLGEGL